MAPAAWDANVRVPTMMTTADMALKMDPEFRAISERFRDDQSALDDAFADLLEAIPELVVLLVVPDAAHALVEQGRRHLAGHGALPDQVVEAALVVDEVFASKMAVLFVTHTAELADQAERRLCLSGQTVVSR